MRPVVLLSALLTGATVLAQVELPVFGKQAVINGYAKDIEGEVLSYFSVYPEHATTALLTRATDGKKAIAWETAVVPHYPQDENIQYYYFSWIAAHNSTTSGGDRIFDLYINDQLALALTTHHDTRPDSWSAAGADSTKLVFDFNKMDRHGDAHGFAHLRVPGKYITPGQPLKLKVVGHAQDSPDWFMTFRYSFKEKVEVETLPFIYSAGGGGTQPLQLTVMHFGGPASMKVRINDGAPLRFDVVNGLQVVETPIAAPHQMPVKTRIRIDLETLKLDTTIRVDRLVHRKVHLAHHSHNDIGYSHLQSEVEVIQNDNIRRALDLIERTKDYPKDSRFVWNIESLWAVENFMGIASEADKQRFIAAVKSGRVALSANYANILTGLCTPEEMHWIVEYSDSLEKMFGTPINSAMQTDIPGMSWSMVDAYAAHGIRYLSQGPNYIPDMPDGGDRIGSTLREQGDKPYWWKGTTGRDSILVWTAGQGYGGWHGFTPGAIKERGTRKIAAYMNELAAKGYPYDMVQWRYNIVSDNGPVDSTLSDFVREWNEKYISPRLIISNVGDMMAEFERKHGKSIPTWSGDFTPYWEDGAYSTAKEEGDVRVLSARLSNLIEAARILGKPIDPDLLYRAKRSIVMWHEHTWGSWCSISDPDAHFTTDQWRVKKAFADSAGWYVNEIEREFVPRHNASSERSVFRTLGWHYESPLRYKVFMDQFSKPSEEPDLSGISVPPVSSLGAFTSLYSCTGNGIVQSGSGKLLQWSTVRGVDEQTTFFPEVIDTPWYTTIDDRWRQPLKLCTPFGDTLRVMLSTAQNEFHVQTEVVKKPTREKESLHLALPFNIPNATVRIGIGDTCVTPETGRIPGSNNDFFCAQRWIDVSNDSIGVTIVCPQGAIWEVGEMVDERKTVPGRGTNAEKYKAWKTEAKSSSTIYLYALNNYWHTNFKADQEGPITFDLYLKMHGPFKLEDARRFGLEMTRPLITWWK